MNAKIIEEISGRLFVGNKFIRNKLRETIFVGFVMNTKVTLV